ncbi:hypothetical protein M5689_011923 [Euphorbia peplus]|nr:hypothetical protein M5689_011923 [Euphorbia peplus]
MAVVKDDWVIAAMTDDNVVVDLLVRLKQPKPQPVIPLRWGLRLPRSKPPSQPSLSLRCDIKPRDTDRDFPARFSPTTPLSWSCGGGAGGSEETSSSRRVSRSRSPNGDDDGAVRSKGTTNAESASTATTTKRSKRKKTYSELKEEEDLLMKESIHLREEIANLNATFKQQTARNDDLKRIKVDLNLQCVKLSSFAPEGPTPIYSQQNGRDSGSCDSNHDRSFLLPDLNSMPLEEDLSSEALSGTR